MNTSQIVDAYESLQPVLFTLDYDIVSRFWLPGSMKQTMHAKNQVI